MARRSVMEEEEPTEINLSAMIDCIFILLIFFIVTTVFVEEKGLQVAKPDSAASSAVEETRSVTLELGADGKVTIDGKGVALADVPARVKGGMVDEETPVVIRANAKAPHGAFVAVWDAAKRGGAQALSFDTVN